MRPVTLEPEPPTFDSLVRQRGLAAIRELCGQESSKRKGRKRKVIASDPSEIPPESFPAYWCEALPDLLRSYKRICSYLSLYLEKATGNQSVDHFYPKSRREGKDLVYEWSNYRLCAACVNAKKKDRLDVVDPFECQMGWFELEFVAFQVKRGRTAPADRWQDIDATLSLLNTDLACRQREEYITDYEQRHITKEYLERRAPFLASEYFRQKVTM